MGRAAGLSALLVLLLASGAVNYRRNAAADAAEFRPYRGVSSNELEALIAAQQHELDAAERAWKRVRGARAEGSGGSDLMQHVGDFERAQRTSGHRRALGERTTVGKAELERMQRERARRSEEGSGWQRILHLATRL